VETCPVVEHLITCIGIEEVKTVKDDLEAGTENDTQFEFNICKTKLNSFFCPTDPQRVFIFTV